ncbi:hypothetical protein [Brevibacterium linens]|uniref:hypothetical protein n=1 Tax=Brevibacterium linens TaxID=1703 RepID=UPI003BF55F2A
MSIDPDSAIEGRLAGKALGDIVQLRFADEGDEIKNLNAAEMAQVLQGIVELTSQLHKTGEFGDGLPPEVRVRPPQPGSFIIEAVMVYQSAMDWAAANPEGAVSTSLAVGGAVTQAIRVGMKTLKGNRPNDFDYLDNGNVKVRWQDGSVDEMHRQTWERLRDMKRPTKSAMRKITTPLSDDADVLQVRNGNPDQTTDQILEEPVSAKADRNDYRAALSDDDEIIEEVETFEAEAQMDSVDFRPGEKWRVKTNFGQRQAIVEDEDFLRSLDQGRPIRKDDIFDVTIRENRTIKNGRTSREWSLERVALKRRGGSDADDTSASAESSGADHA